jgi:putative membrane protein
MGFMLTAVTACQQNSGVQAAREDKAASDNAGVTANSGNNALSAEDREIAFKIEQGHIEEMNMGRFVRDKTNNGDVKSFAKMMIDDHNDALNKLQNVLKDENLNRSTNPKPADEASNMSALQNTSGADLDREYMNMMVQDHEKDLDELRNAEGTVQNPDLKNYIQDLIPIVQKHLEKAQNIQNDLKKQESR